jgi:short chain dehydrogenase
MDDQQRRLIPERIGVALSLVWFGVPALLLWLATTQLLPILVARGWEPLVAWFLSGALVLAPLLAAAAATIVQPDNVAVVTGAALGIGRAMCNRLAEAGMSVVAADLPGEELDRTVDTLKAASPRGADGILEAPTDVADPGAGSRSRWPPTI